MRRAQPLGGGCGRLRGTILLLCTLYNLAQDPTSDGRDGAGAAGKEELSVVVMNDHASALGAWLTALRPHRDPPAAVVHIDRHSDLAAPRHCAFPHVQRWESCVDRAGFQLAAAWLGVVDRIWWLRPGRDFETTDSLWTLAIASPLGRGWPEVVAKDDGGGGSGMAGARGGSAGGDGANTRELAVREGPLAAMDELHEWWGPAGAAAHHEAPSASASASAAAVPHILDVDLDFWGGAAGPLPPPWEMPPLQSCGAFLRGQGAAAWAEPRFGRHAGLWAPLLRATPVAAAAQRELAVWTACLLEGDECEPPPSNRTLRDFCADQLTLYAHGATEEERRQLRLAHGVGLSVPEALLSIAQTHAGGGEQCGAVDEEKLARMLSPLRPRVVTIARSVDGYMPWHCAEILEAAILRTLRLAYNRTLRITYLPGTVAR